jgi:hypothetical protein
VSAHKSLFDEEKEIFSVKIFLKNKIKKKFLYFFIYVANCDDIKQIISRKKKIQTQNRTDEREMSFVM